MSDDGYKFEPLTNIQDGNRGNAKVIAPPLDADFDAKGFAAGNLNGLISPEAHCVQWGELISVVFGVQRDKTHQQGETILVFPLLRGQVDFGIGTTSFTARFDILNGTVISVPAESFNSIAVHYDVQQRPIIVPDLGLPSFMISAGVAYNGVGHNSNPARYTELVYMANAGVDQVKILEIPPFAISMTVIPINDGAVNLSIYGESPSFPTLYSPTFPITNVGQYNVENAVPLPNGARFVKVAPAVNIETLCYVIFGLAL